MDFRMMNLRKYFKQKYCAHECAYNKDLVDHMRNGLDFVECAYHKCGKVFKAECGLYLKMKLVRK
jgi:hypothetical protein